MSATIDPLATPRNPMWVVEVFSTRRNAWEQDGGDSAYSNEQDALGHRRSIRSRGVADHQVRISHIVYGYEGGE